MRARSRVHWALLALLCGCGEPDGPVEAGVDRGVMDARPGDAGSDDAGPDAEVIEADPVTCPAMADQAPRLELQPPGTWRLEGCEGLVELHFTVPPRTLWHIRARSEGPQGAIVFDPTGENPLDTPAEVVGEVLVDPRHPPVVTIRWVECVDDTRCGADQYCALDTFACADCADGDELFDTRRDPAPRTDARPRTLSDGRAAGVACAGFDDWYAVPQPAGQPLPLIEQAQAYVADPTAATLADLEIIPLIGDVHPGTLGEVEPVNHIVPPAEADRTVWVRLATDAPRWAYAFEVVGCWHSAMCLPWWSCGDAERICRACDGVRDAHGDDDVRSSAGAAPVPLHPGAPLDGAVCGVDEDWYAVALGDPASRIEIMGAIGFAYPAQPGQRPAVIEEQLIQMGSRLVLRSDAPDGYPGRQVPEAVWVHIGTLEDREDFRGTFAYTISVEDGDFCSAEQGVGCPAGRVCDEGDGRCVAADR